MSTCAIQSSGAIDLYFYGELTEDERRDVTAHLQACAECRSALDELHTISTALAGRAVVASPPGGDWTSLMSRIDGAVAHERVHLEVPVRPPVARRRTVPAYLALAALLTLVTASVAYLARVERSGRAAPQPAARLEPVSAPRGEAAAPRSMTPERSDQAFAAISAQHFERSKLVILGLASRDPQTSSSGWAYERQLAGALLDDTRLYKQAAEARGLGSLAGVMSDLELVLLQTSLSDQGDATSLDRLQRLIRKRDLVSKMETTRF